MKKSTKNINLDLEFKVFRAFRNEIPVGVKNFSGLLKILNSYNNQKCVLEFVGFFNSYLNIKQSNNHNFMKSLLDERRNTHVQLNIFQMALFLKNNKVSIPKNLATKKIMSNYFILNDFEEKFDVLNLETKFLNFTRGNDIFVNGNDDLLKDYFALQFSRREFFLYDFIYTFYDFNGGRSFNEYDLFDYVSLKYIYNKALIENYKNCKGFIGNKYIIYQQEYLTCFENKIFKTPFLISESNTFILYDFLMFLNTIEPKNFDSKELNYSKKIFVTVGAFNKLCFLIKGVIFKESFFEKINGFVHHYWDYFMLHGSVISIVINKGSPFLDISFLKDFYEKFKILEKSAFIFNAFEMSKRLENKIYS